jgi:hypothetical protein
VNCLRSVLTIDDFRGAGMLYNPPVFLRMAGAAKPSSTCCDDDEGAPE